jgi:endonuclease/exonuclease/phosphatase family metal-dependent hydrolase
VGFKTHVLEVVNWDIF